MFNTLKYQWRNTHDILFIACGVFFLYTIKHWIINCAQSLMSNLLVLYFNAISYRMFSGKFEDYYLYVQCAPIAVYQYRKTYGISFLTWVFFYSIKNWIFNRVHTFMSTLLLYFNGNIILNAKLQTIRCMFNALKYQCRNTHGISLRWCVTLPPYLTQLGYKQFSLCTVLSVNLTCLCLNLSCLRSFCSVSI